MKNAFVALALVGSAVAMPQGVTSSIAPASPAPSGCSESFSGNFEITVVNVTSSSKRDIGRRQLAGTLTCTLEDGTLKDQAGRTGYVAANDQFQFDSPPQTGAKLTTGFSVCSNNSLAIGGSAIWYQCYSGGFYNLYTESQSEENCNEIYMVAVNSGGGATQQSDGQPAVSTQGSFPVPSATGPVITQISDAQPQAPTNPASPVISQISDGQPQAPTAPVVISQISDGQPQAPTATGPVLTQISDGQPQAPTGVVISQISDGQPQAPTGPVITQISDGQPQAPTGPVISQISDGQPQVPTGGNYTAPNATSTRPFLCCTLAEPHRSLAATIASARPLSAPPSNTATSSATP